MKNNKHIKISFMAAVVGIATFMGTSSFTNREQQPRPALTITVTTDAQFLAHAAEINLEEIQLGKLAQTKSLKPEVRDLGALMEKNHTQALSDLTALASKKGISLPTAATSEANEKYKELNNDSEKKFNEKYCDLMIKGHKQAIALFETAAKDSKDSEIREWASATLPTLRTHLEHSKMCKEKCEKM